MDIKVLSGVVFGWLKRRGISLLVYTIIAGCISLAGNTYFIAIAGGFNDVPTNGITLSRHTFYQGAFFWALLNFVIFGIIATWHRLGTNDFWLRIFEYPMWIGRVFGQDTRYAFVALFLGIAIGFIASAYPPAVWDNFLIAILLVAIAPSNISIWLARLLSYIADKVIELLRLDVKQYRPILPVYVSTFFLGASLTFLIVFFIERTFQGLGLTVLFMLFALYAFTVRPTSPIMLAFIAITGILFWFGIDAMTALADDGGLTEFPTTRDWWESDQSTVVIEHSYPAGIIGSGGGLAGGTAGELVGGGDEPEADETAGDVYAEIFGTSEGTPSGESDTNMASDTEDETRRLADGRPIIDMPLGDPSDLEGGDHGSSSSDNNIT